MPRRSSPADGLTGVSRPCGGARPEVAIMHARPGPKIATTGCGGRLAPAAALSTSLRCCWRPSFAGSATRRGRGQAPLLDPALFTCRTFTAGLVVQFGFWAGQASYFLVLALYLQLGRGLSPLASGLISRSWRARTCSPRWPRPHWCAGTAAAPSLRVGRSDWPSGTPWPWSRQTTSALATRSSLSPRGWRSPASAWACASDRSRPRCWPAPTPSRQARSPAPCRPSNRSATHSVSRSSV